MTVIAGEGLSRASFARIAREAKISPALISYYFGSRDALLREILRAADARMDAAMAGADDEPMTYSDAFRQILVGYVQRCASHPSEVAAAQAIRESSPQAAEEARERVEGGGAAELIGFLVEAQESGGFRAFDPGIFADAVFAAMRDVPRQLRTRRPDEYAAFAAEFASLFVHAATERDSAAERVGANARGPR